jgi:hypothetical protein
VRKVNELIIRGEPSEVAKLMERIETSKEDGWERKPQLEEALKHSLGSRPSTLCLVAKGGPGQPMATLFLRKRSPGEIHVSSILPVGREPLTEAEYNHILYQFQEGFLKPVADGLDVEVRIDPFRVKLENIISREAFEKLELFCKAADKFTISPRDRHRWSRFVTQVHIDNSGLDSEELDWWLGHSGWPEEQRRELVEWYEEGLSMLKDYDEVRVE